MLKISTIVNTRLKVKYAFGIDDLNDSKAMFNILGK